MGRTKKKPNDDDDVIVPEVITPMPLANSFVCNYTDYKEDDFICLCAVSGSSDKTIENYLQCFDPPDGADEEQIKGLAHALKLKLYTQIQEKRKELRAQGLLKEMETTGCSLRQLAFIEHYLFSSNKSTRIIDAYRLAYGGEGVPPHMLKVQAYKVLNCATVKTAIEKYRKQMEEDLGLSFAEYLLELDQNREQARRFGQVSAMNAATVAKGRAMGYDKINIKNEDTERTIEDLLQEVKNSKEAK